MKKTIIILIFLILNACDYTPVYSTKDSGFTINNVETSGNNKINKIILKKISRLKNDSNNIIYDLKILSSKEIKSISKDSKGNTKTYEMIINIDINIIRNNNIIKNKKFLETFSFNNTSNKFELSQYKNDIEKKLIENIIENLILTLKTI